MVNTGKGKSAMTEYDDSENSLFAIPGWMKLMMVFIDRVGFPVLAFILMFYMAFTGVGKMTTAMERNAVALTELVSFEKGSNDTAVCNQKLIMDNLRTIQDDTKKLMLKEGR